MLAVPAMPVELFRYRGAAKDGGTLEYVFEAGEQNSPNAVTKEKAAEIAADFMTTFYHVQVGARNAEMLQAAAIRQMLLHEHLSNHSAPRIGRPLPRRVVTHPAVPDPWPTSKRFL